MATETKHNNMLLISLNKREIVDMIGLLTAQLADVPLQMNSMGACPSVNIIEHGMVKYRLVFCLDEK